MILVATVAVVVGVVVLYPRPLPTSNLMNCVVTRFGVFTVVTIIAGADSTVNMTETSVTSFTSTASQEGQIGSVVSTISTDASIAQSVPGMSAAGNATRCTYVSESTTSK